MKIVIIIGWIGAIALLISYSLSSFKLISNNSNIYKLINLFGSLLLIFNALSIRAYPFVVINIMWFISSAITLFRNNIKGA